MYMYYDLSLKLSISYIKLIYCLYLSNLECDTSVEHSTMCVSVSKHGVLLCEDDTQAQ